MKRLAIIFAVLAFPASAQQSDAVLLQRVIPMLQQQRNAAQDAAAVAEAKAAHLAEEAQKLKARIEELEKAAVGKQPGG